MKLFFKVKNDIIALLLIFLLISAMLMLKLEGGGDVLTLHFKPC